MCSRIIGEMVFISAGFDVGVSCLKVLCLKALFMMLLIRDLSKLCGLGVGSWTPS